MSDSDEEAPTGAVANVEGEVGDFGEWEEDDEEERATRCLFSSATHASPTAALQHASDAFGFDMRALYKQHSLDFYSAMQTLNYARAVAAELGGGDDGAAAAAQAAIAGIAQGKHRDEKYLVPTLENDPVLFEWEEFVGVADDIDEMEDDEEAERRVIAAAAAVAVSGGNVDAEIAAAAAAGVGASALLGGASSSGGAGGGAGGGEAGGAGSSSASASASDPAAMLHALAATRAENDALRLQVLEMSQALGIAPSPTAADDDAPANIGAALLGGGGGGRGGGGGGDKTAPAAAAAAAASKAGPIKAGAAADKPGIPKTALEVVDDDYFGSYSFFDIHRTMLDDVARTATYRAALEKNPSMTSGKRVVDIGCGTGILSMFAARGGAEAVVGVDGAAQIAAVARANIAHAGFDGKVTVVQGKVEELLAAGDIPGAGTFDVLVSEWMGYALLYESMLDTAGYGSTPRRPTAHTTGTNPRFHCKGACLCFKGASHTPLNRQCPTM